VEMLRFGEDSMGIYGNIWDYLGKFMSYEKWDVSWILVSFIIT
jgi:hypothetical protein